MQLKTSILTTKSFLKLTKQRNLQQFQVTNLKEKRMIAKNVRFHLPDWQPFSVQLIECTGRMYHSSRSFPVIESTTDFLPARNRNRKRGRRRGEFDRRM